MRYRSQTLRQGSTFQLTSSKNPKTGSKKFIVSVTSWRKFPIDIRYTDVSKHFDPHSNRQINGKMAWKFNTKDEAEALISIAILKGWG